MADGIGQDIHVLRGRWTKRQLMRGHTQHGRKTHAGLVHLFTTQTGRIIRGVGLHFSFGKKPVQSVHDLTTGIRPACIFKESLTVKRRHFKRGELGPHPCNIHHRDSRNKKGPMRKHRAPSFFTNSDVYCLARRASFQSALINEIPINAITTENGSAPMIMAVLIAPKPPASSRPPITSVRITPQTMM